MKKETLEKYKKELDILHVDGNQITFLRANNTVGVISVNDEPTMTQQQYKDEVDVNNIMAKYQQAPNPQVFIRNGKGVYGDFTKTKDFHSSLDAIIEAEDAFMSLDARIRSRFENDPGKLLQFLSDPKNLQEATELGLVEKPTINVNDQTKIKNEPTITKTEPTT